MTSQRPDEEAKFLGIVRGSSQTVAKVVAVLRSHKAVRDIVQHDQKPCCFRSVQPAVNSLIDASPVVHKLTTAATRHDLEFEVWRVCVGLLALFFWFVGVIVVLC